MSPVYTLGALCRNPPSQTPPFLVDYGKKRLIHPTTTHPPTPPEPAVIATSPRAVASASYGLRQFQPVLKKPSVNKAKGKKKESQRVVLNA